MGEPSQVSPCHSHSTPSKAGAAESRWTRVQSSRPSLPDPRLIPNQRISWLPPSAPSPSPSPAVQGSFQPSPELIPAGGLQPRRVTCPHATDGMWGTWGRWLHPPGHVVRAQLTSTVTGKGTAPQQPSGSGSSAVFLRTPPLTSLDPFCV